MKVLACDDEYYALEEMKLTCSKIDLVSSFHGFNNPASVIDFVQNNKVDVALLDIEITEQDGINLAKRIKEIDPEIKIIFVTGYSHYAFEAFQVDAIGYLLKPYSEEQVRRELMKVQKQVKKETNKRIFAKTFGNFDLFVDGKIVKFHNVRAKEMLAILVDRKGSNVTSNEIMATLFEDEEVDESMKSYYRNIRVQLAKTLSEYKADEMLTLSKGECCVNLDYFDCDLYQFLAGEKEAHRLFCGEYMTNYSWAEDTLAMLLNK